MSSIWVLSLCTVTAPLDSAGALGFRVQLKALTQTPATHECYLQELSGANPGYFASPQAKVAQSSTFQSIPSQPMEIGHHHLANSKKARQHANGLCLYCGNPGGLIPETGATTDSCFLQAAT